MPRAMADERRDGGGVARLGAGGEGEFVKAAVVRMNLACEAELDAEHGLVRRQFRVARFFADRAEIQDEHALARDPAERRGEAVHRRVGIEPRRERKQRDDPAHAAIADGTRLFHDRLREAPGEERILRPEPVQLAPGNAQEHGMGEDHGGMAVRLAIEKGALAERVAGAEDLLDMVRAVGAGGVCLTAAADDEEDGVARLALVENDGAFRVLGDGGFVDEALQRAGGKERKDGVGLERIGVDLQRIPRGGARPWHQRRLFPPGLPGDRRRRLSISHLKPAKHNNGL